MKHKTYLIKYLNTGQVVEFSWIADDFKSVGISPDFSYMPLLEAHQLVNHWNLTQDPQFAVYALKESE